VRAVRGGCRCVGRRPGLPPLCGALPHCLIAAPANPNYQLLNIPNRFRWPEPPPHLDCRHVSAPTHSSPGQLGRAPGSPAGSRLLVLIPALQLVERQAPLSPVPWGPTVTKW
jgi:hypothetical protein